MRALIVGAGSYGQVFLEYLEESGISVAGFLDDDESLRGSEVLGVDVLGSSADAILHKGKADSIFVPIGHNRIRREILNRMRDWGFATPSFIHPSVRLPRSVIVEEGSYVMQGAEIMPFVSIGRSVIISSGARIAHHSRIAPGAFASTGVNLGAAIEVGRDAMLGIGSTVMTGVQRIGEDATVGAGAVVIRDVEDGQTVVGNPARPIMYSSSRDAS